MFATQHPRRPRPPGARRPSAQLRAAAAAAGSELSAKTLLNSTTPPPKSHKRTASSKKKGKAKAFVPLVPGGADADAPEAADTSVEHIEHALSSITPASSMSATSSTRTRPLSLSSDIFSAASPPPPYGFISLPPMRDEKSEIVLPPPPPAPLESGPSSVRTSWISTDSPFKSNGEGGDATAGDTLTLEGFRRFMKDRDEELAVEVSARLAPYETATRSMRSMHDTRGSNPSPTASTGHNSSPAAFRLPPFQYRAADDLNKNFTFPKGPRWCNPPSTQREYERRLAYLQAEEEEERIAQLEAALADAREGEEAQRKANARLMRDNTKLRRALEHAEDAAEHLEQEALRSSASSARSSPLVPLRERPVRAESEHERVGWGAVTFPEFPRVLDTEWRININVPEDESEDSGEATQRPTPEDTPQPPAEEVMGQPLPIVEVEQPEEHAAERELTTEAANGAQAPANPEPALLPAAVIDESPRDTTPETTASSGARPHAERARHRPLLSSSTFVSPGKSRVGTPRLESGSGSSSLTSSTGSRLRRSPYPSPHLPSPHHQRTDSVESNGTGPHRRTPSFGSFNGLVVPLSATKPATPGTSASPQRHSHLSQFAHLSHISPRTALAHRMDSVRSYVTEYGRTLGSELGSSYTPSQPIPTPARGSFTSDDYFAESEVDLSVETVQGVPRRSRLFQSSSSGLSREVSRSPPTAAFVLRGSMSRSQGLTAYEQLYESEIKRIRPTPESKAPTKRSQQPWASPSPSPHLATLPMLASGSESDESEPEPEPESEPLQRVRSREGSVRSITVAGPSAGAGVGAVVSFVGATPLSRITGPHGRSPSPGHFLAPGGDPWDEYSDRTTPSPRSRSLRPLLLGSSKTAAQRMHIQATHRRASRYASGNNVAHPVVMAHRRNASLTTVPLPRAPAGPVTIPGRIMHDVFCIVLIILDYIEWAIILVYRLLIDIRAGPDAAIARRRTHAKRYYL